MSVDMLPGNGPLPAAPPNIEFKYFLALPEKVRVQIYDLVLWRPNGVYVMKPRNATIKRKFPAPDLGLLRVNKKIAQEAAERYYANNTFVFAVKTEKQTLHMFGNVGLVYDWYVHNLW
ncbi:hypothetical protein VTJ04DRAFT_10342 [Mycothermus thermophilus]|uniref:uncharacterized protein n=1 Tax=Humicola insolens TaxID=85995 RepID=UPI003743B7E8